MKPITKGKGKKAFTLFYPFSILDGVAPFNLEEFILHLDSKLPETINVKSVKGKGTNILRVSGMLSYEEAVNAFNQLKRIFLYLSIESDIAIFTYDALDNIKPASLHLFPPGWPDGEDAGWDPEEELELIRIDGVANIVYPVIVPEHEKIVDSGVLVGRRLKSIKSSLFPAAINYSHIKQASENYKKAELAAKAYINAFSHNNPSLQFLSLVTCLEILAEKKERSDDFKNIVGESVRRIKDIKGVSDEETKAIAQIASLVGNFKNQSIKEALQDLINDSKQLIIEALPERHPHKNNPMDAIKEMYVYRSKITHSASLDDFISDEALRSHQFAHCAAKALLKNKLDFA